ncbi:hypothetical protein MUB24_22725 [Lederbergia sp. NSJ-179]|uniref:hypothetical protein n=1 Tax=Lederbergia sp. NSJ-179 TaxID=2931402 RepID=UPI001FD32E8C|nr:hypothetical protein [Lederbergia sp. NSJ-179]MCJ7843630.1 hypothetical protein [Lederbergia sp. NSJ-179]
MGRDEHSTISRERKPGTVEQLDTNRQPYKIYFPDVGARVYEENRKNVVTTILMASWKYFLYAEKNLKADWSPDVVVGHAKKQNEFDSVPCIKTQYNWIDHGDLKVKNMDLVLKLVETQSLQQPEIIKELGTSIEERSESIETRKAIIQRISSKSAPAISDVYKGYFKSTQMFNKRLKV